MRRREDLPRYLAPAAFLAVVTIAALLVRAGLHHGSGTTTPPPTTKATVQKKHRTTPRVTTAQTSTVPAGAQYYSVQSGDTYGSIASRYATTVQQLEQLNPGVSPSALRIGQRIRVK